MSTTPAASLHLACPKCLTVNRVPSHKLSDHPICGECRSPLLPGKPIELNDQTFAEYVRNTDLPVLIDFWAPWCGPCQAMAPVFAQAAEQIEPQAVLAKVNTETAPQTAQQFNIRSIPTLVLYRKDHEVARTTGSLPLEGLVRWTKERCG